MARRKKWFLSRLWLVMDRGQALAMLTELGLSNKEARVLLKRFWDNMPIKSIGEMTVRAQYELLPAWDNWVESWCRRNCDRFMPSDQKILFGNDSMADTH